MSKEKLTPIEQANKAAIAEGKKSKARQTKLLFDSIMGSMGIPLSTVEYKFHPIRQWRFDYCYPEKKIALEVEGGVHTGGRHTSGPGFMKDMEKYNAAVLLGWRVVRTTPENLLKKDTADLIRELYNQ